MATDDSEETMGQTQAKQQSQQTAVVENSSPAPAEASPVVRRGRGRKPKSPVKLPRLPFDRPRRKRRKKVPLDASGSRAETISNGSADGTIEQQQSSAVLTSSNKPIRLLLKMDDSGTYSHTIPNGGVNNKDDQPPPPLPLNDDCSVEFFNSIKKTKKLKKKKKHHRHHHPGSGNTSKQRSTDEDSQSAAEGPFQRSGDENVTLDGLEENDEVMMVDHLDATSSNGHLADRSTSQQATITLNGSSSSAPPKNSLTNGSAESSSYPLTRVRKQKIIYEEVANTRPRRTRAPKKVEPAWQPMEVDEADDSEPEDQQEQQQLKQTQPPKDLSLYRQLRMRGVVEVDANNIQEILARREKLQELQHRVSNGARRKMLWSRSAARLTRFQEFLLYLLRKLKERDPQRYFAWPITNLLLPGYLAVTRNPMDFSTIEKKILGQLYTSVQEMKFDVRILCENALKYHSQSGGQYRAAAKLWLYAKTRVFSFCAINRILHAHFSTLSTADVGLGWTHCPVAQKQGELNGQQQQKPDGPKDDMTTQEQSSTTSLGLSKPLTLSSLLSDVASEPKPVTSTTSNASSSLVQLLNKQSTDASDGNTGNNDDPEHRRREELADGLLKGVKINGNTKNGHADVENDDADDDDCKEITEEQIRQELIKQFGSEQKEEVERLVKRLAIATKETTTTATTSSTLLTRLRENGTTSLGLVAGGDTDDAEPQTPQPSLGALIGPLAEGPTALPEWNEPEDALRLRPVEMISTCLRDNEPENPFTSHLPLLDTSKANVTLEESQLLLNTFGAIDTKFDEVIETALNDQDYLLTFSGTLLDIVGKGEYSKQIGTGRPEVANNGEKAIPTESDEEEEEDEELVNGNGEDGENTDPSSQQLQKKLNKTEKLLERLQRIQRERLASHPEPIAPGRVEIKLAGRITNNLVEMIKDSTAPEHIYHLDAIRRAMGVVVKQGHNALLSPEAPSNGDEISNTDNNNNTAAAAVVLPDPQQ